jgi:hypothetical protein
MHVTNLEFSPKRKDGREDENLGVGGGSFWLGRGNLGGSLLGWGMHARGGQYIASKGMEQISQPEGMGICSHVP